MLKAWNRLTALHAPLLIAAIAMISACVESGAEPMAEAQSPAAQPPASAKPATAPPSQPPPAAQTPPTFLGAPPVQFDGARYETRRGPRHGEHTDEVLAEVGYEMDEILQLKIDGAIH